MNQPESRRRWLAGLVFAATGAILAASAVPHSAPRTVVTAAQPQPLATICPPRPLEVHFLVDNSNCLLNARANGEPAAKAIAEGIGRVLDRLQLDRDTAAVIEFSDAASVLQAATNDRAAILDALGRLRFQDDSARLDLGYEAVATALGGTAHRADAQVVTLAVADGPMNARIDAVQARAGALRDRGARHTTIGIGALAQFGMLRSISEPGGMEELDFGGDLIGAYARLGDLIAAMAEACPVPTVEPPPDRTPAPTSTAWSPATLWPLDLPYVVR